MRRRPQVARVVRVARAAHQRDRDELRRRVAREREERVLAARGKPR
jgi:hypothetical protein